jgi:predicted phage replisome organizer
MFWFKVSADFDTDSRMAQIETKKWGIYYAYIYIKLQALAALSNQAGGIYIADGIPHNAKTLANKWHFRKSVVENALKALCEVKLIEIVDDTIFIADWEQVQNAEKLDKIRENNRLRKQKSRAKRAELQMEMSHLGHKMSHLGHALEEDKDKEKEKEIEEDGEETEDMIDLVVNMFNSTTFPKIKILSPKQKSAVIRAVKEIGLENLEFCFKEASESKFLNGENSKGWVANFDWLIDPHNVAKVLNGNYNSVFGSPAPTTESSFDLDEFYNAALARGFNDP